MRGAIIMYFILSDIHGCYEQLKSALLHWDSSSEHLIVLGDLIDRGPQSLAVVQHLMELQESFPNSVTILKGNHEHMFTSWLVETPFDLLTLYYNPEHNETLRSFYPSNKRYKKASRRQRVDHVIRQNKKELSFLANLPYYYETDQLIFVHAGYNQDIDDWRNDQKEILWSRRFPHTSKPTHKKTFFGHTPTPFLHDDRENFDIWTNDTGDRVCIDGGVAMHGQLNALRIDSFGNIIDTLTFK